MKKGLFKYLITCMIIISLIGCKDNYQIAMETQDPKEGLKAFKRVNYPRDFIFLAQSASTFQVREAAVNKLDEQSVLESIAEGIGERVVQVRIAAINRLNSQQHLARIASNFDSLAVCKAAVDKVTDQYLLIRIAYNMSYWKDISDINNMALNVIDYTEIGKMALKKITNPTLMLLIDAFEDVPEEHRSRLIADILPAMRLLNEPEVIKLAGEPISVKINWNSRWQNYAYRIIPPYSVTGYESPNASYGNPSRVYGEWFECSIKLENKSDPLLFAWETEFPSSIKYHDFVPAEIDISDLLQPIINSLPKDYPIKMDYDNEDWWQKNSISDLQNEVLK